MIRIDLHMHSFLSRKNGDGIKWDSLFDSITKLKANQVQICGFSDHNVFDCDFYLEAYNLAQTAGILVLPAMEVNVVRLDGQIANIIYVFEENLPIEKLKEIQHIAKTKIPKRGISLTYVNEIFKNFETIKIPHVGKSDHFKFNDLQQITYDAIEISNNQNKNYLDVTKKGITTSVVAFSDTHKWNVYPEQRKLITLIDKKDMNNISFKSLKQALNKNKNYSYEEGHVKTDNI